MQALTKKLQVTINYKVLKKEAKNNCINSQTSKLTTKKEP